MQTFEYYCETCKGVVQEDYPVGKAAKTAKCPQCDSKCERYFGNYSMNFILKGGGWPGKTGTLNREMNAKQDRAGKAMKGTWAGTVPKLIPNKGGKRI